MAGGAGYQYQGPPPNQGGRPRSGEFDGPGEPSRGPNPYGTGLGYDPAKSSGVKQPFKVITNTRVELPPDAYRLEGPAYDVPHHLPLRPGFNTVGKDITIRVNQFKVLEWPQRDVFQYDVQIGNDAEKRGKIMAVWNSNAVQSKLRSLIQGPWLWDGNKIAWCAFNVPEQRILVDLDAEKGRTPRPGKDRDQCYCVIRPSKTIRMAVIDAYISRQIQFDNGILEAINFLDHVLRQGPSEQYTMIKRSFFARGLTSNPLDNVVVAMKGVYSSMRLCNPLSSIGQPCKGLAINVDVANGTFWAAQDVHQAARNYCSSRNRNLAWDQFAHLLKPVKNNKGVWCMSDDFKTLRKMSKLQFRVKHRGKNDDDKLYYIKGFTWSKDKPEWLKDGQNAKNTTFGFRDKQTGVVKEISVYDYFQKTYNIRLQYWMLPLIVTSKGGMFPMETCTIVPNQRYNFKLGPDQTAAMIKFAVTRPKQRLESISHGIGMLKWSQDRYLAHFGIKVDNQLTQTKARLLQNPEIQFTGSKVNPGTSGKWDLRGKKFFASGEPLKSWGFCILEGCLDEQTVRNFANTFVQVYSGHGGAVANRNPPVLRPPPGTDLAKIVVGARNQIGNQSNAEPQIIFFVMSGRDSFTYERLKKNMECRFAMVSQCLNVAHVAKGSPQYCSNVSMKVNAKMGGTTCKIVEPKKFFANPTMIIGADVSHASPGSPQASMAALTMSMDVFGGRYAAAVETNGYRVEMITEHNLRNMLLPLFHTWLNKFGGKPENLPRHIYYFRDGVSEGQYAHVLNQEVANMKKVLEERYGAIIKQIKWTVTICTKRHHIRFFPKEGDGSAADKNNNPLPGTLVERDVTHPFEYDFYLCAHSAIQGTARPVHYQVILDEQGVNPNLFQSMVYQHSYQYMRSTTPVSLFPAIYYAHLASNRARSHESFPSSVGPRGGQKFEEANQDNAVAAAHGQSADGTSQTGTTSLPAEAIPLVPMGAPDNEARMLRIRTGMWYI